MKKNKLMTVKEFALKHGVEHQAIRYHIKRGTIATIDMFGITLIDSKTKYKPRKQK